MAYRGTPHPEPYTVMEGRKIKIKLDYNKQNRTEMEKKRDKQDNRIQR